MLLGFHFGADFFVVSRCRFLAGEVGGDRLLVLFGQKAGRVIDHHAHRAADKIAVDQHPGLQKEKYIIAAPEFKCTVSKAMKTRDGFALLHENEVRDGGTVRVEPWGSVAGVTAVEDGDVRLELRASYFEDLPDEPILRAQEETLADPQGRFRFSPLPPGQYVLTRHGAEGTTTELEFDLTAGESASVQL